MHGGSDTKTRDFKPRFRGSGGQILTRFAYEPYVACALRDARPIDPVLSPPSSWRTLTQAEAINCDGPMVEKGTSEREALDPNRRVVGRPALARHIARARHPPRAPPDASNAATGAPSRRSPARHVRRPRCASRLVSHARVRVASRRPRASCRPPSWSPIAECRRRDDTPRPPVPRAAPLSLPRRAVPHPGLASHPLLSRVSPAPHLPCPPRLSAQPP